MKSLCRGILLSAAFMPLLLVIRADLRVIPQSKVQLRGSQRDSPFRLASQWTLIVNRIYPTKHKDIVLRYDANLAALQISYADNLFDWLRSDNSVLTTVLLHANGSAEERVGDECGNEHSDNMVVWKAFAPLFFGLAAGSGHWEGPARSRQCPGHQGRILFLPGIGNMAMCIGSDNVPQKIFYSADPDYVGPSNAPWVTDGALIVKSAQMGPPTFQATGCSGEMWPLAAPCPGEGIKTIQVFRFYNFHGEGLQAADVDTSDLPGTAFDLFDGYVGRRYVKALNITVDTRFGPYRDCNWNGTANHCEAPSQPGMARLVTRSSPFQGFGPHWGQCSANELTGSWLTFPSEGQCRGEDAVGTDGCTWRVHSAKSIEMSCIASALKDLLQKERNQAPYPRLQKAILDGLETCPAAIATPRPLLHSRVQELFE
jgi:hypothetical protein